MTSGYHCARCGAPPRDDYPFRCADCGRALGICSNDACGFGVRLFESADPIDCDGCGYAQALPEEEERLKPVRDRLMLAMERQLEALRQMESRSGPIYERAREGSRVVSEAYRAAGRPRDVTRVRGPDGWQYVHQVGRGHGFQRFEPATEEEWRAWDAWCRERERLRERLRPVGNPDEPARP